MDLVPVSQFIKLLDSHKMLKAFLGRVLISGVIKSISTGEMRDEFLERIKQGEKWSDYDEYLLERYKEQEFGVLAEQYFLEKKGRLDQVVFRIIRVREAGLAQELYFRIEDDEVSFQDVAQAFSEGVEADTGGLVGPVALERIQPELASLLQHLNCGQLSSPLQLGQWWVLVRLEKLIPARFDTLLRRQIIDHLFNQFIQTQVDQVINDNKTGEFLLKHLEYLEY